jgi:glycosyltransferase involved in cell wall biosynthesis
MRILWCSAPPGGPDGKSWLPTGYAQQTGLIVPRLAALGHEVAIAATACLDSHASRWKGFKVFPKTPYADFGEDVTPGHYAEWNADLAVTFLCTWILHPAAWRDMRVIHLTPVDCDPMSVRDNRVICDTGGIPAAVTRHGEQVMRAGGPDRLKLDPLYLPHGVDVKAFAPPKDREGLRKAAGVDGRFVVGMNFMNNDKFRKNIDAQVRAFAQFHVEHPDALLALHSIARLPEGFNLPAMLKHYGVPGDAVLLSPQYQLVTGMIGPAGLADWYGTCDVVLEAGNEGFGLCRLESQACGTPVITGDWGTGPELNESGWRVSGELAYNDVHQADWRKPYVAELVDALGKAHAGRGDEELRAAVRQFACRWDIDTIVKEHWGPVLDDLAAS